MNKLQLYVLDDDTSYAERLVLFIRSTDAATQLQVKLFTHPDVLLQELYKPNLTGVLLLSETYYPLLQHHRTPLYKMFLSANIMNSNGAGKVLPFLFRFQPLYQLISRIQALFAEGIQFDYRHSTGVNRTRVISLYSSSGYSGKSVTAVHLAKQLAFRGERVFYLSLETISAASQWLQGESVGLSQLLYYLKSSPEQFKSKLALLKSHDTKLRFDYLIPKEQMREMHEMSGDIVRQLITSIVELSVYDTLIIDLESSVHPRIVTSLEMSDEIIWLVKDDCNDAFKTESLYAQMRHFQPIHFVMACYRGSQTNSYDFLGKEMSYRLPYIPEWKVINRPEQIWHSELFSEQVYEMLANVLPRNPSTPNLIEGAGSFVESTAV
ncbi:hypothetical protein [Paenibacillus qinlingensis]|uniref:AAA domain-containing protein n=1 Tax=Paenibacillus qinlingensis TaxID=1837343 RepID=A0ABU1NQF7_9BACL|nr:hypothetical protein [Paenibacillus qinlingensis]MDR6549689.1 hypothetical protein [Paenibacillus qinlingensis]